MLLLELSLLGFERFDEMVGDEMGWLIMR